MIIDNCSMQMVSNPHQFDVLVMGNLYGAIIDNICSGLVGGAGVVGGASYSPDSVVFEPVIIESSLNRKSGIIILILGFQGARHTYSEAVGKNVANPAAMIICACSMLFHVNLQYHSRMIFNALVKVLKSGKHLTKDLGGQSSTNDFTHAVIRALH